MANKKCPKCGQLNCGLYLEETEGWFICQKCGRDIDTKAREGAAKNKKEVDAA